MLQLSNFSRVSLVALLQIGYMEAGFDAMEKGWLYTELAGYLLQLACWPTVFVLVFMFVFVPSYWLPPKLAVGVQSLMFFKS